ncbi:M6 family metalloprotease domain-containing protein [Streptomyces gelaticus]|uniref:M6 family metalloprotease domain-containing protein n=1 Tax=Streptomyces gelaticus TaxID=285446 RepID=A0ABQ2W2S8_9ACTN|nr:M6 family metalloprotease domain-containing protein [Streptomyces gelaticus]GGV89581.1 M6 family metalloprotease domain-containing protein [Streptomyces gelaticus]
MQKPRRRIRNHRHPIALASATALVIAVMATASNTLPTAGNASAGPVATARSAGVAACRLTATTGVQMSEGMPTQESYARSTGKVRALNLMIDFPDAPGAGSAMDRYAEFFPQTTAWFRTASYGRLTYVPETPLKSWLRMPLPFSEYGVDRGSPYEPGYRRLVEDIVSAADPKVDFASYDLVNILVTPNAGPSALDTVLSVTFSGNDESPRADGVPLANASFIYSRQDDGSGSYKKTGYRVLPHENGHVFGLPDLYTMEGGGSVGHWDIMSEDWGADNDLLGWHKWKLGWLDNSQISCAARSGTSDHVLGPLATRGGTKLAFVPLSSESGYAVEVRTKAGNDHAVCRPGVLIYKVSSNIDTGQGPVSVADSTKRGTGCTRLPNVHAALSDATFRPGETFTDRTSGIHISVVDKDKKGNYRIRITRP